MEVAYPITNVAEAISYDLGGKPIDEASAQSFVASLPVGLGVGEECVVFHENRYSL